MLGRLELAKTFITACFTAASESPSSSAVSSGPERMCLTHVLRATWYQLSSEEDSLTDSERDWLERAARRDFEAARRCYDRRAAVTEAVDSCLLFAVAFLRDIGSYELALRAMAREEQFGVVSDGSGGSGAAQRSRLIRLRFMNGILSQRMDQFQQAEEQFLSAIAR